MSDNIRHPSLARKAGRGLIRALRGLFGPRAVRRAGDSWETLKQEYREGRADDAAEEQAPPKRIPHREKPEEPENEEGRDPAGTES